MPATPHFTDIASDACHQRIAFKCGAVLSVPPRRTSGDALVLGKACIVSSIMVQVKFGLRASGALGGRVTASAERRGCV